MSDQSEDLRLAESLDMKSEVCLEGRPLPVSRLQGEFYAMCAAELRRQHSRIEADEALMRQATDALKQLVDEKADYMIRNKLGNPFVEHTTKQGAAAITALRKRLESRK